MSDKKIISPENLSFEKSKNFFYKKSPKFMRRIFDSAQNQYLSYKYRQHSDNRELKWDWKADPFNRIAHVNLLIGKFFKPRYLEIGCAENTLFNSVYAVEKTGVDPVSGGNIRKKSDDFFNSTKAKYDVIFIDGLHTYSQVRKDVINSIKHLSEGGYIVLHDMLPRNWKEHHIPILTRGLWTGDVWKVGFELAESDGIDFKIIKIDCGVGVFRVTRNNVILKDLTSRLKDKEFTYFYDNLNALPIIDYYKAKLWIDEV